MSEEKYLIESIEHTHDDTLVWWKPNSLGYTINIDRAGRYSKNEAYEICNKANYGGEENERMWLESEVLDGMAGIVATTVTKR